MVELEDIKEGEEYWFTASGFVVNVICTHINKTAYLAVGCTISGAYYHAHSKNVHVSKQEAYDYLIAKEEMRLKDLALTYANVLNIIKMYKEKRDK